MFFKMVKLSWHPIGAMVFLKTVFNFSKTLFEFLSLI